MSGPQPSKVFMFNSSDPEMQRAYDQARATFGYLWREISWERRRIVPGLDLASVKAAFSDDESGGSAQDHPEAEQMWLGEIDFDGLFVSGELLNAPQWLKSVKQKDSVRLRLREITDWMYAIGGEVYGAYTVNLMRSRMSTRERKDHDKAWGLDFGDPHKIRLVPEKKNWFSKGDVELQEHPMSEAMAPSLKEELAKNPSLVQHKDEKGWTFLHHEALAGSTASVKILLECGADPNAVAANGATPLRLAKVLGWERVVKLLVNNGATR
jgi:uncharacterized protein YegJ (DUF2314 family)